MAIFFVVLHTLGLVIASLFLSLVFFQSCFRAFSTDLFLLLVLVSTWTDCFFLLDRFFQAYSLGFYYFRPSEDSFLFSFILCWVSPFCRGGAQDG